MLALEIKIPKIDMMINNSGALGFEYEPDRGMNERELLEWLRSSPKAEENTEELQTNRQGPATVPEWLLPKPDLTDYRQTAPAAIEASTDTKVSVLDTPWDMPWSPTPEEESLPVTPELKTLISKGLHVLTDERRLLLLILIGTRTDGSDNEDICNRYLKLISDDETETSQVLKRQVIRQVDTWLVGNGLAERFLNVKEGVTKTRLTGEGQKLLPLSGHLIDWAINNGNIRPLLGRPKYGNFPDQDKDVSPSRQNLEHLSSLLDNPKKRLRFRDLLGEGLSEEQVRTRLIHLREGRWIIALPSADQPEGNYPIFVSREFPGTDKYPKTTDSALKHYISSNHADRPGTMTLHGLVYHRLYRGISTRLGGNKEFASEVFQEYERLFSNNEIEELNPGTVRLNEFVLSRAKEKALRDLVSLVRGADVGSDRYESLGLRKILQRLASPSEVLGQLAANASAAEN